MGPSKSTEEEALEAAEDLLEKLEASQEREAALFRQVRDLRENCESLGREVEDLQQSLHLAALELSSATAAAEAAEHRADLATREAKVEARAREHLTRQLENANKDLVLARTQRRAALREVEAMQIALDSHLNANDEAKARALAEQERQDVYEMIRVQEHADREELERIRKMRRARRMPKDARAIPEGNEEDERDDCDDVCEEEELPQAPPKPQNLTDPALDEVHIRPRIESKRRSERNDKVQEKSCRDELDNETREEKTADSRRFSTAIVPSPPKKPPSLAEALGVVRSIRARVPRSIKSSNTKSGNADSESVLASKDDAAMYNNNNHEEEQNHISKSMTKAVVPALPQKPKLTAQSTPRHETVEEVCSTMWVSKSARRPETGPEGLAERASTGNAAPESVLKPFVHTSLLPPGAIGTSSPVGEKRSVLAPASSTSRWHARIEWTDMSLPIASDY
jgi:hypothetical protein